MLTTIFCEVDDFCNDFEKIWRCHLLDSGTKKRLRDCTMSLSEIMTIDPEWSGFIYRVIVVSSIITFTMFNHY